RALLTRVNPYTGLSYTADPCVAVVEINNENALLNTYRRGALDRLAGRRAEELRGQWNAWLEKKYASSDALKTAWAWTPAPLGDERIAEGAFDRPVEFDGKQWILDKGTAEVSAAVSGGVLQVTVTRDGSEKFPKIYRRVSLEKDQPYTVSFRVRQVEGGASSELGFAVARTQGGWQSLGLLAPHRVGKEWTTVRHTFLATETTDRAEIQFTRFKTGAYEIDDLSFRPGAVSALNDPENLELGAVPVVKNREFAPPQTRRDFYEFLIDAERGYWTGIAGYLKDELKVKAPISGTQVCGYSPPMLQAELDYVDNHAYWCHPSVHANWEIRNAAMVNSMSCILAQAGQRVAGKPYTVSEYNHPFPNQYGAEGQPMLRAYGALQDWDGVFEYTYNHSPDFEPRRNTYFFSMIARTEVLAHFPACAAIYLRGDVREARQTVTGALAFSDYFDRLVGDGAVAAGITAAGLDGGLALVHKTAMDFSGKSGTDAAAVAKPDAKIVASDTGELVWNRELPGKAYWTVNTPNTKLFSGFPEGREIALGGVRLALGATRLGWATVSITSRRATGFGERGAAATLLLAATGVTENEGTQLEAVGDGNSVALRDRVHWGDGTVLAEGIPAAVTLPSEAARTACYALDERGDRKAEGPVATAPGGCRIEIGPQYRTVWYEIAVAGED
ncbi:MAG: carbohydrate binding domain-containing protein, partial [Planctomycetota bacterium]|nr:carbohydrate binding domain-containing protein [Planctomycetota bacterium]